MSFTPCSTDRSSTFTTESSLARPAIGKRQYNVANEYKTWDFLKENSSTISRFQTRQTLDDTKFQKGFMRRQQPNINQDAERKLYSAQKTERGQTQQTQRTNRLKEIDGYSGYNFRTGENDLNRDLRKPKERRHCGVAPDLAEQNEKRLLGLAYRFHRTTDQKAPNLQRRTKLVGEGMTDTKRQSAIIGFGSAVPNSQKIASDGSKDAFRRIGYDN